LRTSSRSANNPQKGSQADPSLSGADQLVLPEKGITPLPELGQRWQFPSDHIPVAADVMGTRLCTWNVLNSRWTSFFEQNEEGLAASSIIADNIRVSPNTRLTVRDQKAITLSLELLNKVDLLLLQECGPAFSFELAEKIPAPFQMIRTLMIGSENDIFVVYNSQRLSYHPQESQLLDSPYEAKHLRPIMNLLFQKQDGSKLRVIHSHVPGDPELPCLNEFADHIGNTYNPETTTIVAGDLNFLKSEVQEKLAGVGISGEAYLSNLNTSLGPKRGAKCIDHIIVLNPSGPCQAIEASELAPEIVVASSLINP
jgi:endonuclease/exonuclease/phosphatase family metal-dependent hydrolase